MPTVKQIVHKNLAQACAGIHAAWSLANGLAQVTGYYPPYLGRLSDLSAELTAIMGEVSHEIAQEQGAKTP